ncbi:MAG TPA: NAD(P)H-dependent oxidoreductase [Candidatus Saccharimonadales bacterium]|nr:NAD(P)H-dependent oxidoreductase [Candidatus Saccharimonadales bacterium]
MKKRIVIAVLAGTTRPDRLSIHAARYVADFGRKQPGVEIIFVDPNDFAFPNDGNDPDGRDPRYTDITEKADAFFIVTPEYNHSFPGSLKRMLDTEYDNYYHKPVALAGASNGLWGGTRACEALLSVCRSLGLLITRYTLYFPRVQDIFDEQGRMRHEYVAKYEKNTQYAYDELLELARALKEG